MQLILRHKQKLSLIIALCMVVIVVLVCVGLGFWQLERGEKKQQQLNAIAQLQTHGVMSWSQLIALPVSWNKTGILVELQGKMIPDTFWLLDNQVYQGKVGYDLLVLFKPRNETRVILVNLGWVKAPITRDILPKITLPKGEVIIKAQIKQDNLEAFTLQSEAQSHIFSSRIQSIDLAKLATQSAQPLVEFIAYRQGSGDNIAIPHYKAVVMSPQKHKAYAVQWFLIACACIVIAFFAGKKRIKNEK